MVCKSIFEVFKSQLISEKVYDYKFYNNINTYTFTTDSGSNYKVDFYERDSGVPINDHDIQFLYRNSRNTHRKEKYFQFIGNVDKFHEEDLEVPLYEIVTSHMSDHKEKDPKEAKSVIIDTRLHILKYHMTTKDIPLVYSYPASERHESLYERSFRKLFKNDPNFSFIESIELYGFLIINFKSKVFDEILDMKYDGP